MTRVRDLLDVAAGELNALSCRISLGEGPRPQDMAQGWSLLLPAAQHLIRQGTGLHGGRTSRRAVRAVSNLRAPNAGPRGSAPPAIVRTARAIGAAGDLLSTAKLSSAAAERRSILDEATELLTAAAEITLHGIGTEFAHSETLISAAEAGGASRGLARCLRDGSRSTSTALTDVGVPTPALPLGHPLGAMAGAVHEWRREALRVVATPGLSSHDLRGTALVAGHLTAACRCLLALGPPDATAPTDADLDRSGRAWTAAAGQWATFVLPGTKDHELPRVSWEVTTELRRALMPDGRWIGVATSEASLTPTATVALRRAIQQALHDVAAAHRAAVHRASLTGGLVMHVGGLPAVGRLASSRHRWVPAPPELTHPVVAAYARLVASLALQQSGVAASGSSVIAVQRSVDLERHSSHHGASLLTTPGRPPSRPTRHR